MLRSGVCSVEGSFKIFLALDNNDELPLLWLSEALEEPDSEGHFKYELIIMSKKDQECKKITLTPQDMSELKESN